MPPAKSPPSVPTPSVPTPSVPTSSVPKEAEKPNPEDKSANLEEEKATESPPSTSPSTPPTPPKSRKSKNWIWLIPLVFAAVSLLVLEGLKHLPLAGLIVLPTLPAIQNSLQVPALAPPPTGTPEPATPQQAGSVVPPQASPQAGSIVLPTSPATQNSLQALQAGSVVPTSSSEKELAQPSPLAPPLTGTPIQPLLQALEARVAKAEEAIRSLQAQQAGSVVPPQAGLIVPTSPSEKKLVQASSLTPAQQTSAKRARLAILGLEVLTKLRYALDQGESLTELLGFLAKTLEKIPEVPPSQKQRWAEWMLLLQETSKEVTQEASQEASLATLQDLQSSFSKVASVALAKEPEGGFAGVFSQVFGKMITLRPVGMQEGETLSARIARAETHLQAGNLPASIAELEQFPAQEVWESWLSQAKARQKAIATLESLTRTLWQLAGE